MPSNSFQPDGHLLAVEEALRAQPPALFGDVEQASASHQVRLVGLGHGLLVQPEGSGQRPEANWTAAEALVDEHQEVAVAALEAPAIYSQLKQRVSHLLRAGFVRDISDPLQEAIAD